MLETTTLFARWQNMNPVVARSAKSNTIINIVSIIRIITPRFRMVNNRNAAIQDVITVLASKVVTNKALITPFNIQYIVTPLNFIADIFFSLRSFCITLLYRGSNISTLRRAKSSFIEVIQVSIIRLATFFTVFITTSLFHDIMIARNQYEIK